MDTDICNRSQGALSKAESRKLKAEMKTDQALAILRQLINSPVLKLALGINDLSACALAVETLSDAVKPKPDTRLYVPAQLRRRPTRWRWTRSCLRA